MSVTCCGDSVAQVLYYRRFLQFHKDHPDYRTKWLIYLTFHMVSMLVVGPLAVFIIYLTFNASDVGKDEFYDEYLLLLGLWIFFVFRAIASEVVKRRILQVSEFYQFPISQVRLIPAIRKPINRAFIFYHLLWFFSSIFIGFTPCVLRVSDIFDENNSVCFYNEYHLAVMIVNIFGLLLFGHTLGRASVILSKRWEIGIFFAKESIKYWDVKERNQKFPSIADVKKWHEFMLNMSYPIQSIAKRRVFISTMFTGLALPIIALIILIALPTGYEQYFVIIQFLEILAVFEITILYSVFEAATMNHYWEKSVKSYSKWLFDPNYAKYLSLTTNPINPSNANNTTDKNEANLEQPIIKSQSLLEEIAIDMAENGEDNITKHLPMPSKIGKKVEMTTVLSVSVNQDYEQESDDYSQNKVTSTTTSTTTTKQSKISTETNVEKNGQNKIVKKKRRWSYHDSNVIDRTRQGVVIQVIDQVVYKGLIKGKGKFQDKMTIDDQEKGHGTGKGFSVSKKAVNVDMVEWGVLVKEYLPILNFWNRKFKGVSVFGIPVDYRLFFRLLSITLINVIIFGVKARVDVL